MEKGVFSMLSWFRAETVKNARVMVAGAGALGNEVLKNLALFGVGNIVIVDFDTIEHSNLTRSVLFRAEDADRKLYKADVAAKRIKEINPDIHVTPLCGNLFTDVGLGLYRQMDVIIGCLDNLEARVFLNRLCFRAGKSWVDGAIGDLEGTVSVYQSGKNCYECNLTDEEKDDLNIRMSCAGVVKMNESAGRVATTPVSASIIAAVQVQEAMKIIHEESAGPGIFSTLTGKLFVYEGMHPSVDIFNFSFHNPECNAHELWSPIIKIPELGADTTVSQAIDIIKKNLAVSFVELNLINNKFVDRIVSRTSDKCFLPMLPESKIPDFINYNEELRSIQISEGFYQNDFENIDHTFPYQHLTLNQIGIPYFDVIRISTEKEVLYVELSKDKKI
jgi:Dinucleotide-utilizing enzymes involved in molybdopterin and thiamine biosynthesis family 2